MPTTPPHPSPPDLQSSESRELSPGPGCSPRCQQAAPLVTQKTKVPAGCVVPEDRLGAAKPRDRLREAVSCPLGTEQTGSSHPGPCVCHHLCLLLGQLCGAPVPPPRQPPSWIPFGLCLSARYPPPHMGPPHLWTGERGQGRMGPGTAAAAGRRAPGGGR